MSRVARLTDLLQGSRPVIMGILNVTPDSFSDGGLYYDPTEAMLRAERLVAEGADIIDIGGESTRPSAEPVMAEEQMRRILPIIRAVRQRFPGCFLSVDTTHAIVAEAALTAGADMVNDVSAGLNDSEMLKIVAKRRVPVVLMHMKGTPKTMQENPSYMDVVQEVRKFLKNRIRKALAAGILREKIIIDPGIGFGKRKEDNLKLLAELERFVDLGYSVLLGTSRKRFMGAVCGETRPTELLGATIATTALGVAKGVKIFRVHDVLANRQAAEVAAAIMAIAKGV